MSQIDRLTPYTAKKFNDGAEPPLNAEYFTGSENRIEQLISKSNEHTDRLNTIQSEDNVEGSIKHAVSEAKKYTDDLVNTHIANKGNPHEVTKAQVGLGNVDNMSVAAIKTKFTGVIAEGNTGFVEGSEVFDAIANAKPQLDNESIVYKNGMMSLNKDYIEYLDNQLYPWPEISIFDVQNNSFEVGTSQPTGSFSHKETNVDYIEGSLTLTADGDVILDKIQPSAAGKSITIIYATILEEKSITYKLSGVNTKETEFSSTYTVSFYFPSFIGAVSSSSVSGSDVLSSFRKIPKSSLSGSIKIDTDNEYAYFISTKSINSIKSGGFDVSYTKLDNVNIDINGVSTSYNVYRTNEIITESLTYVVS